MNLIEQLGGYENSKCYLESCGDMDSIGGFTPLQIQEALLQYRKQHNIFEVGDKAVLKNSRFGSFNDSVYDVVKINKTHLLYELDCGWCGYSHYLQHASDAEIKVGHRL